MIPTQPKLGAALRAYRELRGEGIRAIAAQSGVSKGQISRVERGSDVQLSTLNKILAAHGLKLSVVRR